jgi:hypothetical protein
VEALRCNAGQSLRLAADHEIEGTSVLKHERTEAQEAARLSRNYSRICLKATANSYTIRRVLISLWLFLFAAQPKEFFLDGLKKLEQRSNKCVELRGEYVE